jgi:hypothetical protein
MHRGDSRFGTNHYNNFAGSPSETFAAAALCALLVPGFVPSEGGLLTVRTSQPIAPVRAELSGT